MKNKKQILLIVIALLVIVVLYYMFFKKDGMPDFVKKSLEADEDNEGAWGYWFGGITPFSGDEVIGCTDPNSDTYNSDATVNSGNCLYVGCQDIQATNYDSLANFDPNNNLCEY